jgi:cell division protein FtsW
VGRRALIVLLVAVPATALAALGVVIASAPGPHAALRVPSHFVSRHVFAAILGALVALGLAQLGPSRTLRAAPVLFACALFASFAVFAPGVGVRAAGANRWLRVGPFSGNPAPLLTAATALLLGAWGAATNGRRALAIGLAVLAVLTLVAQPDFSAAAVAAAVVLAGLAGAGVEARRLLPAAAATVLVLALVASRFGYVGNRVSGFLAPEADRRGKGWEVLTLARAQAGATSKGAGLGRGVARRRLSSPGSDYVFAVVREELGRVAAGGVIAAWLSIGAGAVLAARSTRDPRLRAGALAAGTAALAPAALHVAVCQGWVPIIGVSMPLLSYDPAATVATGAELGFVAAVALTPVAPGDAA